MTVTIRRAVENDLPAILEIVNHAIQHTTAIYDYEPRTPDMQLLWFKEKQATNHPVLVADDNRGVVGFGTFGPFRFKAAYQYTVEHSIYVSNKAYSGGIGTSLMNELIAIAKQQEFHMMIGVIDAGNQGSIRFHERFGFESCGIIREVGFKFGRWLDLNLMQLILK